MQTENYVNVFKALANEHRLHIYNILTNCCTPGTQCSTAEVEQLCVGDLNEKVDIASSTLSHHLKELHQAGLVNMTRSGKQVFCSINTEMLSNIKNFFNHD